jgi:hypothetical protein
VPRAIRPLFAVAVLLLLVSVVALGIRSSDDAAPTALPDATETGDGTDPGSPAVPSETLFPDDDDAGDSDAPTTPAVPSETLFPDAGENDQDLSGDGDDGTEETDATDGDADADGDGTADPDATGTDDTADPDADAAEERAVDDMPNTGGGAATALGGLVALSAAAGIARRR